MYITVLMHGILGLRVRLKSKSIAAVTSEIANWRLVEGTCTTAERPLAAQPNNKKVSDMKVPNIQKQTRIWKVI